MKKKKIVALAILALLATTAIATYSHPAEAYCRPPQCHPTAAPADPDGD